MAKKDNSGEEKVKTKAETLSADEKNVNNAKASEDKSNNIDYLMNKLKYLGFPNNDYVKEKVQGIVDSGKGGEFTHYAANNSTIGMNNVEFKVKINHSDKNDKFYFGGYDAKLSNKNNGTERSLSMNASKNPYTAKEAINLLEGRMVKRDFPNGAKGFVGMDFNSPKNEFGNHKVNIVLNKEKINVENAINKSAVIIKESDKYNKEQLTDFLTKSLEKGNFVKSKIDTKDGAIDGFVRFDAFKGEIKHHDDKMKSIADDRLNVSENADISNAVKADENKGSSVKR